MAWLAAGSFGQVHVAADGVQKVVAADPRPIAIPGEDDHGQVQIQTHLINRLERIIQHIANPAAITEGGTAPQPEQLSKSIMAM